MPMLDERLVIFHEVGDLLEGSYQGRFHRFIASRQDGHHVGHLSSLSE